MLRATLQVWQIVSRVGRVGRSGRQSRGGCPHTGAEGGSGVEDEAVAAARVSELRLFERLTE